MSGYSISNNIAEFNGDIAVGRGQLGISTIDTISSDITLWTTYSLKPTKYIFIASGADRTVTLPVIGINITEAQPGHEISIICDSTSPFNIIVNTSAAVLLQTVTPGNIFKVVAKENPAVWEIEADSTSYSDISLQKAYDGGNSIILSNNPVEIFGSNTDPAETFLSINDNGNINNILDIKNTAIGFNPAIQGFGATTTGSNSLVIGNNLNNTNSGSMILGDSTFSISDTTNTNIMTFAFTNGIQHLSGSILPGIVNTDANETNLLAKISTTNGTPTNLYTIVTVTDTSYILDLLINGSETGATGGSQRNAMIRLQGSINNASGTLTDIGSFKRRFRGTGFNVDADFATSGTNILIQVSGLSSTNITWIGVLRLVSYKWQ